MYIDWNPASLLSISCALLWPSFDDLGPLGSLAALGMTTTCLINCQKPFTPELPRGILNVTDGIETWRLEEDSQKSSRVQSQMYIPQLGWRMSNAYCYMLKYCFMGFRVGVIGHTGLSWNVVVLQPRFNKLIRGPFRRKFSRCLWMGSGW